MKFFNRIFFFLSFLVNCFIFSQAQNPGGRLGGMQNANMGHFYGKVIDASTNKPIEAASVQLVQNKLDSATKKRKETLVAGMLTDKKGEFSLENLAVMPTYAIKITAIGFKSYDAKVSFDMQQGGGRNGDMSSMINAIDKDLGNIKLDVDAKQLQEVTITNEKPLLTMAIDRKIFNVEKNLTSIGGSAVDVMKNVPGLNVDIDGNVTMRNASPQIFVDGRPTTMTLEQIPADAIATIEIITNPSAKFDASGGGAGILNVVLKKNRKSGYNGNLRTSVDSRGRATFGGDINIKQQKINLFASGNANFRKTITTASTNRTDFLNDKLAYFTQNNQPIGKGIFAFGRLGADYFIDNRNTITLSGNMSRGSFKNTDNLNIERDTVFTYISSTDSNKVSDYGSRSSNGKNVFRNYGLSLAFKHNFSKSGKELTADGNYNYSKNDNTNDLGTQYFYLSTAPKTPLINERSVGGGRTKFFTAQIDFANPVTDKIKIETGARIALRDFYSFNKNYIKTPRMTDYVELTALNNEYKFLDRVIAAYTTFSHQIKKFTYQLGLRIESSAYTGTLITKNQEFKNEFPFSIFPSAFATYKLTDKQDVQFNFSRKINRPNFFQLIPFIDYTDSLNLTKGNPNLKPEFTSLFELSYQNQIAAGHNLLTTIYYKNTDAIIARYQYKDANPNLNGQDSVIFTSYANASRTYSWGLETTLKNKIAKWWDINTNINLFNVTLNAGNLLGGSNNSQFSWFAKINQSFKLPKNFSIQLSGEYQAKTLVSISSGGMGGSGIPGGGGGGGRGGGMMFGGGANLPSAQGYIRPLYGLDIAIKKEFLKNNAASLTLQVNDIFRTRVNSVHSTSLYFEQDTERRRDPQVIRLNFNWRFGKMDVSLFKRKNNRVDTEGMQGMGGSN